MRRCLALASALEDLGWTTVLAGQAETQTAVPELDSAGRRFLVVPATAEQGVQELKAALPEGVRLLVVDHYGLDERFEAAFTGWSERVLVIDDLADRRHSCDLLLDQTPYRQPEDYRGLVNDDCRPLLGGDYALLRRPFGRLRRCWSAPSEQAGSQARIFVSLGATDPQNATALALQGLAEIGKDLAVDVVLGAQAPHAQAIADMCGQLPLACRLHREIAAPEELMVQANVAIGAAGTSSWERACLGLPTLLVVTADNQRNNASALHESGAAWNLGPADRLRPSDIGLAVDRLLADPARTAAMRVAALRICDGLGAERAAAEIAPPFARSGTPVGLRRARMEDGDLMLAWQRHPDTRRFARNPSVPTAEEHTAWLKARLSDPACLLHMILYGDEPGGVLRLVGRGASSKGVESLEVSIYVAPHLYGQGIGRAALALAHRLVPEAELHANVLQGNEASVALFTGAGYRPAGDGWYVQPPATLSTTRCTS